MFSTLPTLLLLLPLRWQQKASSSASVAVSQPVPDNGRLQQQQQQQGQQQVGRNAKRRGAARRCFILQLAAVIRQFTRHLPLATCNSPAQCGKLSTKFLHLI